MATVVVHPVAVPVMTEVIGWCGTISSSCMLTAPLKGAFEMNKTRRTEGRKVQPYAATWVSSFLWALYGLQIQSSAVVACNSVGILASSYCIMVFLSVLMEENGRNHQSVVQSYNMVMVSAAGSFASLIYAIVFKQMPSTLTNMGYLSGASTMWMFSAPLGQLKGILASRSARVLSPLTISLSICTTTMWVIYGHLRKDKALIIPNAFGLMLCIVQMALFCWYGDAPPREALPTKEDPDLEDVVEDGDILEVGQEEELGGVKMLDEGTPVGAGGDTTRTGDDDETETLQAM